MLLHTFECCTGAVLAVAVHGETVYAGCQDGNLKVWDLETRTLVRVLITSEVRVTILLPFSPSADCPRLPPVDQLTCGRISPAHNRMSTSSR